MMKTKTIFIALAVLFVAASGFTQVSSRKAQRAKNNLEKEQEVKTLIQAKEFVFIASMALSQRGGTIDLTTNPNFLKIHPDKITSYLPYFGRAYQADLAGEGGIKFEGKPKEFTLITRQKGKGYEINATVPVPLDFYQLSLFVSPNGKAMLTVTSSQRDPISYYGEITKCEVQD